MGDQRCEKENLIFESELIDHNNWKTYPVKFNTDKKYTHIILEAYHNETPVRYKGNILVDHLTPIVLCSRV